MVLVDVYVPAVDKEYNFSLNEDVKVSVLIEEISEMIGQKEQTRLYGDISSLNLVSKEKESILPNEASLSECGVRTGAGLILV